MLVYLPILTNDTEYIGFIQNKNRSVPISMRYRKVGNMNRPVKNKIVQWAFVSTVLENNWENSNLTLEKFQKKTLQANYKLNFMLSNVQEDTIYNIIKEIVSDKKRTIFTQSFPIEENFIFEHVINDIYNFNIVYQPKITSQLQKELEDDAQFIVVDIFEYAEMLKEFHQKYRNDHIHYNENEKMIFQKY